MASLQVFGGEGKVMIPLQWYKGIAKDLKATKDKVGIVIHADEKVCRILSREGELLRVVGYPSKNALHILAVDEADGSFVFNGIEYVLNMSWVYISFSESQDVLIKAAYKELCENPKDTAIDKIINESNAKRLTLQNSLELDKFITDHKISSPAENAKIFHIGITSDEKVLADIGVIVEVEDTGKDNPNKKVISFDKKDFVTKIKQVLKKSGFSYTTINAKRLADGLLDKLASTLAEKGIEFDHKSFS